MSVPEFNNKVAEMQEFVRNSTIKGGSSPQQMVQALNTLTASNIYDFKELKEVMLQVSRTGFASGADSNDVALMTVAQRNFGLNDLTRANDQAMKAGQLDHLNCVIWLDICQTYSLKEKCWLYR
jgi:hypothetical protein